MKSSVDRLTTSEREALANFNEDAYKALRRLCQLEIEGLGKDALGSPSHDQTRFYSGQASMAAKIPKVIQMMRQAKED